MHKSISFLGLVLSLGLLLVVHSTLWASLPAATPEADLDKFMTDYMKGIKFAFEEKDDKKSAVLIGKLKTDLLPRYNKLMPELKAWIKSMSKADQQGFQKRTESKPWVKEMLTVGFNPANQQRMERSAELKRAMDELTLAFKDLTANEEGEQPEEDGDQKDNR